MRLKAKNNLLILAFALLLPMLYGCKGRTLDNIEPTGDTVEVIIIPPVTDTNLNDSSVNIEEI